MVRHNNQVPNRHFHKDWQVRPSAPIPLQPPRAFSSAAKAALLPLSGVAALMAAEGTGPYHPGMCLSARSAPPLVLAGPCAHMVRPARQEAVPPPQARAEGE
jgi:hypothetical protein